MKFVDFIGNNKIKEQLTFLHASNRIPHAIIIEGDEGLGKRTLAREIALNLFCRSDGERPCRACPQCSKVLKGFHPDVLEYSAESSNGKQAVFKVDTVREIRDDVVMQPNEADYKVYILGNCHCMNASAQNAILKVLEEPPSYAIFILTTTTKSALLETVLSRSVVISLEGVDAKQGAEYICQKDEAIDYSDAFNAMSVWNGNIGKAIQSLSDGKLSKISSVSNDMCEALIKENEYELLKACSVLDGDRVTQTNVLAHLKTIFRDALFYGSTELLSGNEKMAKELASRLNKRKLLSLIDACDSLKNLTLKNANNAIIITKICYELRRAIGR